MNESIFSTIEIGLNILEQCLSMKANDELYFQLKVKRELWEKFKAKVPSNITLNQAVIDLIQQSALSHEKSKF